MICPFCKETIQDGAIKCKHCGSILSATDSAVPGCLPDVAAKIDKLKISNNDKIIFNLIADTKVANKVCGIPIFESKDKRLSPNPLLMSKISIQSAWGFFFSCWYYLFTGMWRKGLVLFFVMLLAIFAADMILPSIFPNANATSSLQFGGLVVGLLASQMAKYDRYRNLVLEEKFWW